MSSRRELLARATDRSRLTQPDTVPFNGGGYQFWAVARHPVAKRVAAAAHGRRAFSIRTTSATDTTMIAAPTSVSGVITSSRTR
jgi:hypothetical protein